MTHPATVYSLSTRLLHWSMAFCFIGAIVLAYFVIWVLGHDHPQRLPVLNLHWVLGLLVGLLLVPRIVSRLRGPRLPAVPGTPLEHRLAHYAHLSLYALMLVMPLTGYVGTRLPTDFGLFVVPSFKDTALFAWISQTWNLVSGGVREALRRRSPRGRPVAEHLGGAAPCARRRLPPVGPPRRHPGAHARPSPAPLSGALRRLSRRIGDDLL